MRRALSLLCTALASPALISPALADGPGVMAGTPVVHSLVAQVMGDRGAPGLLLDRGSDPHAFQLRPSQARALASADLVFWIGPELTPWMARALDGTGTAGRVVGLLGAEGVILRAYGEAAHEHDDHDHDDDDVDDHGDEHHSDEHGHGHGDDHAHDDHDHDDHDHGDEDAHDHDKAHGDDHVHEGHDHGDGDEHAHSDDHDHAREEHGHDDHDHGGTDPHAWLNPENARLWLDLIAAELGAADPANAAVYTANAAAGRAAIDAAEAQARATLAPVGDAPIMVFHDAYSYFADAFGLNVVGTIALGDAASPGAARLAEMRARLTATGTTCVFPEVNHSPAYAEVVLEGSPARLGGLLDPAGVAMDPGAALYPQLLTDLAETVAACVSGT